MSRGTASARQRRTTNEPIQYQQNQVQIPKVSPKLSVSDAIALISLRLGRLESIVQKIQHDTNNTNSNNEMMDSIFERIQIVEGKLIEPTENEEITNAIHFLNEEISLIKQQIILPSIDSSNKNDDGISENSE
jgi:hypothetical protein